MKDLSQTWVQTKSKKYGVVIYNFKCATNFKHALNLEIGETVYILEECAGWYRGFSSKNRLKRGIFPTSIVALKPFKEGSFDSIQPNEDPTSREVVQVVREWHKLWRDLYLNQKREIFERISASIMDLIELRRELISGTLTSDQIRELKLKIVTKIDQGNRELGLDVVPRIDGEVVDPEQLSPVELYQIHCESSPNHCSKIIYKRSSASSSGSGSSTLSYVSSYHLFFQFKACNVHLCPHQFASEEILEVCFSLYDATSLNHPEYLSEKLVTRIAPANRSSIPHYSAIFTDLGNADLGRDLYLLVQFYRLSKLILFESKTIKNSSSSLSSSFGGSSSSSTLSSHHSSGNSHSATSLSSQLQNLYKRPLGAAILPLNDVIRHEGVEKEFVLKLSSINDNEFHQIHDLLIKKQTNKLNQLQNASITVSLKLIAGSLKKLRLEAGLLLNNAYIVQKRGFPDIIMPGDLRNDLYLTLEYGEFEKGGKAIPKNIEATVLLVSATDGKIIENCISSGAGDPASSKAKSVILYHNNSPKWNELIKLLIPLEAFDGSHIRIEFHHCSSKGREKQFIGFSFVPLSDEMGTIIKNGEHELYVYKCDDHKKLHDVNSYIFLPWGPKDTQSNQVTSPIYSRSNKEVVHLKTLLCSTKLTQNSDLLALLKWRANPESVEDALQKVLRLSGEEIVKFLQDILDALFSMFSTHDGNETKYTGLVFKVLIHIFMLLEDPKYAHFKPVLDTYINGHFAAALVHKGLLFCLKDCADSIKDPSKLDRIERCFRSLEYIFKFIVQSRLLYSRATGEANDDLFRKDLTSLFASLYRMLTYNHGQSEVLSCQIAFITAFPSTYEQLLRVLSKTDLARVIRMVINSLPNYDTSIQLVRAKLRCIQETIKSQVFQEQDSRLELLDPLVRHLNYHISKGQEMAMCGEILSDILIFLNQETKQGNGTNYREVEAITINLLDSLMRSIVDMMNNEPPHQLGIRKDPKTGGATAGTLLQIYVAILISLLKMMDDTHYAQFLQMKDRKTKKEFLLQTFTVFRHVQAIFPEDWLVMRMMANHVVLCALQEFSQPLYGPEFFVSTFDERLWTAYFNLAVSFLTQPALQLETFSEIKRESILDKYGDMRVLMGFQILTMWEKLGRHKIHFIPSMVGSFLEVTLVPEKELRKATLPIFYDMIDAEYASNGNFKQVESNLIDKLDLLVSENKGDDEFRQLFNTILMDRLNKNSPKWKEDGINFINAITKLLELLLDYREVMDGEENRDKRMSCTVNLLNFYKNEINRREMYVRYIYKLTDLHLVPPENYTEAAFTLKLHADLLNWGYNQLGRDPIYLEEQREWQRKEALYLRISEYFDKGKNWEEGIKLCKELAVFYEKKLFDFAKLSSILKTQARFLDNILTQIRPEPEYFRVGFYGRGFPLFLRNKTFVYRGQEYERIAAFTQRLQDEFPKAQVMTKNSPPETEILESCGQYIQICNVKPIPESRIEFEGHNVPEKVLSYYQVNDVKSFTFDRPIHKGTVDRDNEFKSLWIERTTLTITNPLPGILRWFEVYCKSSIEISPLEHAIETVESMNKQLQKLITQYTFEPGKGISLLSMRLQGVIEAAVNGGVAKYQEAFFNARYFQAHPEQAEKIHRLKQLILQKVKILEGGLSLHGRLAPPDVQPLHRRLVQRFQEMRHSVQEANSSQVMFDIESRRPSILSQPLPPIPIQEKTLPDILSPSESNNQSCLHMDYADEQIYSVPQEYPQPASTRPRSAGIDSAFQNGPVDLGVNGSVNYGCSSTIIIPANGGSNHAHPHNHNPSVARDSPSPQNHYHYHHHAPSVQRSRSIPRNHYLHQNSINNGAAGSPIDAPPLPPRTGTLERTRHHTVSSSLEETIPDSKPILPKRGTKKSMSADCGTYSPLIVSIEYEKTSADSIASSNSETASNGTNNNGTTPLSTMRAPPPLPSKRVPIPPQGPPSIPVPAPPVLERGNSLVSNNSTSDLDMNINGATV